MIAVLAYSGCRVGELVKLRVRDYRTTGEHRVLNITGKGNKERTTPLHLEAVEKLAAWLSVPGIGDDPAAPLFRPQRSARNNGKDGFRPKAMTTRAVEKLIDRYVTALGLDANVTVHSLRVTALTTARERGSDIIDLQDFAGHADPRTTLTYIRSRDRLSKGESQTPTLWSQFRGESGGGSQSHVTRAPVRIPRLLETRTGRRAQQCSTTARSAIVRARLARRRLHASVAANPPMDTARLRRLPPEKGNGARRPQVQSNCW
jgi:hypothetical protein